MFGAKLAFEITQDSHPYCSPCVNLFMNLTDNELVGDFLGAPIKSNSFPAVISRLFSYGPIPGPVFVLAPASPFTISRYTDKDLQRATKFALELFFSRPKIYPILGQTFIGY